MTYERDRLGRIVRKQETLGGTTDSYLYSYDLAGRLVAVEKNGVILSRYDYDENGNRLARAITAGTETAEYDAQDRLMRYGDMAYAYTANGELESKTQNGQMIAYDYDELGNLRAVDLANGIHLEYLVDGRNRRIGKKVNGVQVQGFLYKDQLEPVAELNGSGQVVAVFIYGSRPHVPDYLVKGGRTHRIVSDHLGSPRLVIDTGTGEVAQQMGYDELGNVILDTNPRFQPFGFAGGLYDAHTGLVRFGARDYDAEVGRWTTKDPAIFAGRHPNLYDYVDGDPVNFIDPQGLIKLPADPSGLPSTWGLDPNHRDPNGQRFRNPDGDILDFHKGRPGERGWKGKDHWHHRPGGEGGDDHLKPGDEIPDPQTRCQIDLPSLLDSPLPGYLAVGLGAAIVIATLAEDLLTGGGGTVDDPATIAIGVGLIFGGSSAPDH